jgi:CelD/BcsL family acetyltransferase involved in cellulose biosynthesis
LVGVFPLERRWGGQWRTTGLISTAYHDPLIHPDGAVQTAEAALEGLKKLAGGALKSISFDLISPHTSATALVQAAALAAGFDFAQTVTGTADTTVELAPTWDQYLAKLDGHDRKELRRKIRKVEEKGGGRFVVNDTEETVLKALNQVLNLMETDDVGDGSKARKTKWLYRRHFEIAGPALARTGRLVVYQLFVENQLASSLIALPQGGRQLLWNGAMNADLYQWSPGIALMGMIFRRAIEQGDKSIDLLRGNFPYKFSLGAVEHPMHRIVLTTR